MISIDRNLALGGSGHSSITGAIVGIIIGIVAVVILVIFNRKGRR